MISNDAVVKAQTRFHWNSQRMRGSQSCAAPSQDASVPHGPSPQQSCRVAVYSRVRIMPEGTLPQSCPDSRKQAIHVSALFGDQTWTELHMLTMAPLGPLPIILGLLLVNADWEKGGVRLRVCMCVSWLRIIMFFVVRLNNSFNFPLGCE